METITDDMKLAAEFGLTEKEYNSKFEDFILCEGKTDDGTEYTTFEAYIRGACRPIRDVTIQQAESLYGANRD